MRVTSSRVMPFVTCSNRSRVTREPLGIHSELAPHASTAESSSSPQRRRRRVMALHCRWRLRSGQAGLRFPAAKPVRASDNEAMAMTEQEWLAATGPYDMLRSFPAKEDSRKLWLFGCACLRRASDLIRDLRARNCIDA